jgi:hypothetical protein
MFPKNNPNIFYTIYPTITAHIYGGVFLVEITAAKVLARFNYDSTDFDPDSDETTSLTNVEYIIDDVIDFINSEAGISISKLEDDLVNPAGSKTVTVTGSQNATIKLALSLMLRDAKYKIQGGSSLGPAGVSESVYNQDPTFKKMLWQSLDRLRGQSFDRV